MDQIALNHVVGASFDAHSRTCGDVEVVKEHDLETLLHVRSVLAHTICPDPRQSLAGSSGRAFLCPFLASPADAQSTSVKAPFVEQFQDQISQSRWTVSKAVKQTPVGDEIFSYVGTWAVEEPEVYPGITGDTGLVLSESRGI